MSVPSYVLITPARNEAKYIDSTLRAMAAQTLPPARWVIVSDGSTDGTDDIVRRYQAERDWIELVRMPERSERNFAGKVHAFNAGRARLDGIPYDVIGNLDADVSFEPDHFEVLMSKFAADPELGVGGAPFREGEFQYDYRFTNIQNVWGGCQLFRRACFDAIGGYRALEGGCIDHVAVLSARMHGWKTRTFTDRVCIHHRVMGTAVRGGLAAKFKHGMKDYSVGNHPVWELSRAVYQMGNRPYVVGGLAIGLGFAWSALRRRPVLVPPEMRAFSRAEQMNRLRRTLHLEPAP